MKGIGNSFGRIVSQVRLRLGRCVEGGGLLYARSLAIASGVLAFAFASSAQAQENDPTLIDTGVDLVLWVPIVSAALGLVIAAVLGAYFAFLIIKIGVRWLTRYVK